MKLLLTIGLAAACASPLAAQTPSPGDTAAPPPQEIATIRQGQTRSGILEAGDYVMGDGTWADVWYLELAVGQRVVIELRSSRFDAYLQFLDPWGAKLQEDDDSAGSSNARMTVVAREAGRYQIIVNNYDEDPRTGAYTLAVR